MKLGFVGTGTITSAIITGLSCPEHAAQRSAASILVSPRNADVAAQLAARFANVQVAPSNQAVLDGCDIAILAVRPQIAREVLAALRFRPEHHVVSLIATFSLEDLAVLVAPAGKVTRAVPLPAVAQRQGPTAIYPPDRQIAELFERLGVAIEVDSASEFNALCAATGTMASYFAFAEAIAAWLTRHGIQRAAAQRYVIGMFQGLAGTAALAPELGFATQAKEHATLGGINEQVLDRLTRERVFDNLSDSLDAVLQRFGPIERGAGP